MTPEVFDMFLADLNELDKCDIIKILGPDTNEWNAKVERFIENQSSGRP